MIKRIEYLYTLYNNIFAYTPLLHSFYEEYIGQDKDILLSYLILPLVLNETSRNKLVKLTARSSLFTFCKYEECIIGLPERIKQYKAVTNDCIQYGVDRGLFRKLPIHLVSRYDRKLELLKVHRNFAL